MFLPIRTDSPLRTTPYMNWAMIVINTLVFVAQGVISTPPNARPWYHPLILNAADPQLYQFITSGFLHGGGLHLIGNMLFLYIFGNNVNDKMGHLGYLAFYLGSIVFGGVFYAVWDKDGSVLGASGGVSAVVGAYMVLFPRANLTVFVIFWVIGTFEIPSLWFVLAYFLKDVIGLSGQSQVAHSAHVGGTLFGFAVCGALLALNLLPRDQFDVVAMVKQWNRRRQYRDAVSGGWNPYGGGVTAPARPPNQRGWVETAPQTPPVDAPAVLDPRTRQVAEIRARASEAVSGHDLPAAAKAYLELKALDPGQVLSRQAQLDVANQLAQEQRFSEAAEAYETFLRHYPKYEQTEQVELMLGIVLNRFLNQPARAREYLLRAGAKLMDENASRMAKAELEKVDRALAGGGSSGGLGAPQTGAGIAPATSNAGGAV